MFFEVPRDFDGRKRKIAFEVENAAGYGTLEETIEQKVQELLFRKVPLRRQLFFVIIIAGG